MNASISECHLNDNPLSFNHQVPIVILKTKDMRNSTNIFLTNLSIADLLVLLVCTPTVLVEVNSPPEVWVLGEEMCKLCRKKN